MKSRTDFNAIFNNRQEWFKKTVYMYSQLRPVVLPAGVIPLFIIKKIIPALGTYILCDFTNKHETHKTQRTPRLRKTICRSHCVVPYGI